MPGGQRIRKWKTQGEARVTPTARDWGWAAGPLCLSLGFILDQGIIISDTDGQEQVTWGRGPQAGTSPSQAGSRGSLPPTGSLPTQRPEAGRKESEAARPALLPRGLRGWTAPPSIRAPLPCQFSHMGFPETGQGREASGPSTGPPASHPFPRGGEPGLGPHLSQLLDTSLRPSFLLVPRSVRPWVGSWVGMGWRWARIQDAGSAHQAEG